MNNIILLDQLKQENKKLEQDLYDTLSKIDKAIEYIERFRNSKTNNLDRSLEKLLEILGDKENE